MSLTDFDKFAARLRQLIHSRVPVENDWVSKEIGSNAFEDLALELFDLQFRHNEAYRWFCKARQISSGTPERWDQIPSIPAAAFKEVDLSALPVERRTRVFHSSGTTDHRPSRHFHCAESLSIYEESVWPWFAEHLLPQNQRADGCDFSVCGSISGRSSAGLEQDRLIPRALAALAPAAPEAPNSSLVHMFETIAQRHAWERSVAFGVINEKREWIIDMDAAVRFFEHAVEIELPVLVLGTAFSFIHLLDHMNERGRRLRLPPGSRVLETGGYKGRSRVLSKTDLHQLLETTLGISETHIVCEYGMSELSSQGYDRVCGGFLSAGNGAQPKELSEKTDAGRSFRFPPWTRVQIISPETGLEVGEGQSGLIRIFDLANVYSVMAIQTEDLGIKRGNTFELLGRGQHAEPRGCSLLSA